MTSIIFATEKEKGAILLTTTLMISILTLLVLSLMQMYLLYFKANTQMMANHQAFYHLEQVIFKLALTKNFSETRCLKHNKKPDQVINFLLHKQGCILLNNHARYYYAFVDLGSYPCVQINNSGSHHWLITVATEQHAILQIRVAKPENGLVCSQMDITSINEGIISWRFLLKGEQ